MTLQENICKSQHLAWFLVRDLKDVYKHLPETEIAELIKQAEEIEKRIRTLQEQHTKT